MNDYCPFFGEIVLAHLPALDCKILQIFGQIHTFGITRIESRTLWNWCLTLFLINLRLFCQKKVWLSFCRFLS